MYQDELDLDNISRTKNRGQNKLDEKIYGQKKLDQKFCNLIYVEDAFLWTDFSWNLINELGWTRLFDSGKLNLVSVVS